MSTPTDSQRSDEIRRIAQELQALRARLNEAIDRVSELALGCGGVAVGLSPIGGQDEGRAERSLMPSWLRLPSPEVVAGNPAPGFRLGTDSMLYGDYRDAFVQLIQVARSPGAEERYSLVINHAEFDGTYVSIVLDARALLSGMPAGPARLSLAVDVACTPTPQVHGKCSWRVGEHRSERPLKLQAGHLAADACDIDFLDPAQVSALELHLIFNPVRRGTIEIRRMVAGLVVTPATGASAAPSIFETPA